MTHDLPSCPVCGREVGQKWVPDSHCGSEETGPACPPPVDPKKIPEQPTFR